MKIIMKLFLIIFVQLFSFTVYALDYKAETPPAEYRHPVNSELRKKYIKSKIEKLKRIRPVEFVKLEYQEHDKYYYYLFKNGSILFKNGNWVNISTHSIHDDEIILHKDEHSDVIGDVSIAIDNEGNIYISYNHVCGSLFLSVNDSKGYIGIGDFLLNSGVEWENYKE